MDITVDAVDYQPEEKVPALAEHVKAVYDAGKHMSVGLLGERDTKVITEVRAAAKWNGLTARVVQRSDDEIIFSLKPRKPRKPREASGD